MRPIDFFPVQASVLDAKALQNHVLSEYDLPEPVTCVLHLRGDNDTYQVQAADQTFYLRVYLHRPDQDQTLTVATEVDLLHIAHAAGVPVPRALSKKDGTYLTLLNAPEGLRPCVLFEGVPGKPPGRDLTPQQAHQYGVLVGQLHRAWQGLDPVLPLPTHDVRAVLEIPLENIAPYLQDRPADLAFLQQVVDLASIHMLALPDHPAAYGVIHGDLHKTNALVTENGEMHLIDFTVVGYGWRAHDVAVLLWSTAVVSDFQPLPFPEVFEAYLQGYETVRPLEDAEKAALPFLAMAQHLWIMNVEIEHVQHGAWGNQHVTSPAWFDDWIGKLRRWAEVTGQGNLLVRG